MEIRTKKKFIEEPYYIAFDGKEFDDKDACAEYEGKHKEEYSKLEQRIESMIIKEADGYLPCDGTEHNESYCYVWLRVETEQDIKAINEFYMLDSYNELDTTIELPGIVGIEYDETYRSDGIYSFTMADCEKYVKNLFAKLGKKVTFQEYAKPGGEVTVSVYALYHRYGENLSSCGIEYIPHGVENDDCDYYDLYDGFGNKACMDGETCVVHKISSDTVTMKNECDEIDLYFDLSFEEFEVATGMVVHKEAWEEYLGVKLSYEEYSEVDKRLDCMILDYDSKEDFDNDFVWLYGYRSWSEKLGDASEDDSHMQFLVPALWLLEYFDNNEDKYKQFMSEYTCEDSFEIYSAAVLQCQIIFEKEG